MAADKLLVVEKVLFTTITNKKGKGKERPFSSTNTSIPFQNVFPATVVLKVSSLS